MRLSLETEQHNKPVEDGILTEISLYAVVTKL